MAAAKETLLAVNNEQTSRSIGQRQIYTPSIRHLSTEHRNPQNIPVTQLSIPTHAQLQRHRLKFIKNQLKKLLHVSVFDHLHGVTMSSLKSLLLLTTVGCFYAKSGDVAACRVVCIGLYLKSA